MHRYQLLMTYVPMIYSMQIFNVFVCVFYSFALYRSIWLYFWIE